MSEICHELNAGPARCRDSDTGQTAGVKSYRTCFTAITPWRTVARPRACSN